MKSVILHAVETWAMTVATPKRLWGNDLAMIRWICNVISNDQVSSDSILSKLGLQDIDTSAPIQQDEMVWTHRGQQWLDCWSTQAKQSCTEKI